MKWECAYNLAIKRKFKNTELCVARSEDKR